MTRQTSSERAPQWRAPDTLAPSVMAAVARRQEGAALAARVVAVIAALGLYAAIQWALTILQPQIPVDSLAGSATQAFALLSSLLTALQAFVAACVTIVSTPAVSLLLMATGVAMSLIWLGTAEGFRYVVAYGTGKDS